MDACCVFWNTLNLTVNTSSENELWDTEEDLELQERRSLKNLEVIRLRWYLEAMESYWEIKLALGESKSNNREQPTVVAEKRRVRD